MFFLILPQKIKINKKSPKGLLKIENLFTLFPPLFLLKISISQSIK